MRTAYERPAATVIRPSSPGSHPEASALLRVDDQGLWLDGVLAVGWDETSSVTVALGQRTMVHVRGADARVHSFPFTSAADAAGFVAAFGRDFDSTAANVALEPSMLRAGFVPLPMWKTLGLMLMGVLMLLLFPFVARQLPSEPRVSSIFERALEIGADGLRVRSKLVDDFLPYEAIAAVGSRGDAIVLRLETGEEVPLVLEVPGRSREVLARITRAMEASKAAEAIDADLVATLAAAAQSRTERIAALRDIGGDGGTEPAHKDAYRRAQIPRERLWRVVEHPGADAASRARAAVALSESLTNEERARLRIAADATASPKLRVALDAAARDDDALDESLTALDERARA